MATQKKYQVHGYGNIAYDLDALVKERALDDAGRMYELPRQEEEAVQRKEKTEKPKAQFSPLLVGSAAVLITLVVVLLMGFVQLTQISNSVTEMKTEMGQLNDERVALLTRYEQTFEMAAIKEAAEGLGMSKPSAGQIEYVELGGPDKAVVYAAGKDGVLDKFFASVEDGVGAVVEYFQ